MEDRNEYKNINMYNKEMGVAICITKLL